MEPQDPTPSPADEGTEPSDPTTGSTGTPPTSKTGRKDEVQGDELEPLT
jgi:hypothetical protein